MAAVLTGGLRAYRVGKAGYPLFSGDGAMRYGGRWNSDGRPAVYCGLSYAGCLLEILAHLSGIMPEGYLVATVDVPPGIRIEVVTAKAVRGWAAPAAGPSKRYGDKWIDQQRTVGLIVPSLPGQPYERNLVLNPRHPDFDNLICSKPSSVLWDERLFQ